MSDLQKGTPVDLSDLNGKFESPGTGLAAGGIDGRSSQSPLSASRGNADPVNVQGDSVKMGMKG